MVENKQNLPFKDEVSKNTLKKRQEWARKLDTKGSMGSFYSFSPIGESKNNIQKEFYKINSTNEIGVLVSKYDIYGDSYVVLDVNGDVNVYEQSNVALLKDYVEISSSKDNFVFVGRCEKELNEIKNKNPDEYSLFELIRTELLGKTSIPIGFRYAKHEADDVFAFRAPEGSPRQLRVYFYMQDGKFVCYKAILKKDNKAKQSDLVKK